MHFSHLYKKIFSILISSLATALKPLIHWLLTTLIYPQTATADLWEVACGSTSLFMRRFINMCE